MSDLKDIAHWIKHGDQKCDECVRGMRKYMHQRAERRRKDKEKA
jgi:hypothetical protein